MLNLETDMEKKMARKKKFVNSAEFQAASVVFELFIVKRLTA
jgi:hypothetical protein